MVLEVADFTVQAGKETEFEGAIMHAVQSVLSRSPGFISARVEHSMESPQRFLLLVEWATVEDHMVGFRGGPLFPEFRAIVGPFFASPPTVEHFIAVRRPADAGAAAAAPSSS